MAEMKLISAIMCLALASLASDALFNVTFDAYHAHADKAAGLPTCQTLGDLQLRMHPGIAGKGNALCIDTTEICQYQAIGNLTTKQGTISLWVSPQNWLPSQKTFQIFFKAKLKNGAQLLVYKFLGPILRFAFIDDKNVCTSIEIPLKDDEWQPGSWHKLDAVWSPREMRLYLNGRLPPTIDQYSVFNPLTFREERHYPEVDKDSTFALGNHAFFIHDKTHKTAYDELVIYPRPLTELEVKNNFEKHYPPPPMTRQKDLLTVPQTAGIQFTGDVEADFNSKAAATMIRNTIGQPVPPPKAKAWIAHDKDRLYLGIVVHKKPFRSTSTENDDDGIWQMDDGVEVHLLGDDQKQYQFIVNPNGAIWDKRHDLDKTWNGKIQAKTALDDNKWQAEIALPLNQFGYHKIPANIPCNIAVTYKGDQDLYTTWSKTKDYYFNPEYFGILALAEDDNTATIKTLGELETGELNLALNAPKGTSASAKIFNPRGDEIVFPQNPSEKTWSLKVAPGQWRLEVNAKLNQKELLAQTIDFCVNQPLTLKYRCLPSRKTIELDINASGTDPATRALIENKTLQAKVDFINHEGKSIAGHTIGITDFQCACSLPLPDQLPPGDYQILLQLIGDKATGKASATLCVPDTKIFEDRLFVNHDVTPPWTPIKRTDMVFELLLKQMELAAGPFPNRVQVSRKSMFASVPELILNGQTCKWDNNNILEQHDDMVKLNGNGSIQDFNLKWHGELWFDGLLTNHIEITPTKQSQKIDSLKLQWSVPAELARFVLTPLYSPWQDDKLAFRIIGHDFLLWTTGIVEGLSWMPISLANWRNSPGQKQVTLTREGDKVNIVVNIISIPTIVPKSLTYEMLWQPTPGKTLPENWRDVNRGHQWGRAEHETFKVCGYGNPKDPLPYTMHPWTSFKPYNKDKFKQYLDELAADNIAYIPYSQPAASSPIDFAYDYCFAEWERIPGPAGGSAFNYDTGKRYPSLGTCPHTGSGDVAVFNADRILTEYPQLGGLYYDIAQVEQCSNNLHGHGGIDAFGQKFTTSNALSLRDFFIRIRKLTTSKDKILILHAHNRFLPFVHGIGDYWLPGEQYNGRIHKNPHRFYCQDIPIEEYQSSYYGPSRGAGIIFYAPLQLQQWHYPNLKEVKNIDDQPHTEMYLAACIVHDMMSSSEYVHQATVGRWWTIKKDLRLAQAQFRGYWFDKAVVSESKDVLVSRYDLPSGGQFSHLIVASNFANEARPAALRFDYLAVKMNAAIRELWTQRDCTLDDLKTMTIPPQSFLLFAIP